MSSLRIPHPRLAAELARLLAATSASATLISSYTGDSATTDVQIHGGIYRGGQPLKHVLWQDDVKIGTTLADVIQPGSTLASWTSAEFDSY